MKLAKLAKARGIPIVIDAEKDRPFLRDLIPCATFICTNTVFPVSFTNRCVCSLRCALTGNSLPDSPCALIQGGADRLL